MPYVHLRRVTPENYEECLRLQVADAQRALVATNLQSLDEATTNPAYFPLAIYDRAALGWSTPPVPMIGFTMYELVAGVGFILRLMIDQRHQRQGYGRAAMLEMIRRLQLVPEVELIGTSHKHENTVASNLYRGLGFVDWDVTFANNHATEKFLMLPNGQSIAAKMN